MQTSLQSTRCSRSFSRWMATSIGNTELTGNSRKPLTFRRKGAPRRMPNSRSRVQVRLHMHSKYRCKCTHNHNHNHNHKKQETRTELKACSGAGAPEPPEWIPTEPWAGFVEMRKKTREPLTDRAITLIVKQL